MAEALKEVQAQEKYPLHWCVWHNDHVALEDQLQKGKFEIETLDPRGRTPLLLAVTLGHMEATRVLLRHQANVNVVSRDAWTVVQEAVCTGDPELLEAVMGQRQMQRLASRLVGIPTLLAKLSEAPDFYVEMKWEFTSWGDHMIAACSNLDRISDSVRTLVTTLQTRITQNHSYEWRISFTHNFPLVSRMCPSDTYKVYKQGSNVRIDTTLLGFNQTDWQRGNKSYIFKGQVDSAVMMEIDHETRHVYSEQMRILDTDQAGGLYHLNPAVLSQRLTTPVVTTYIDTDKISFERDKAGIWGWRSDRMENVNGHECKVFAASNVELITKTRTEHLTDADKRKNHSPKSPIQSFLNIAETEEKQSSPSSEGSEKTLSQNNPSNITAAEYFDPDIELGERDIGRPKELSVKVQKFKAHLWLAEEYPLRLQEQVMPIVDLMAISSSHFAKLKDFIQMQLPSGFPVKIEIPLFHVLTARITFGNIFGLDEEVHCVSTIKEEDRISCVIDESIFEPPPGYSRAGVEEHPHLSLDDDDEMLQYAIQQSLIEVRGNEERLGPEGDKIDIWEALQAPLRPSRPSSRPHTPGPGTHPSLHAVEDAHLQRAIEESLALSLGTAPSLQRTSKPVQDDARTSPVSPEDDIALALAMSQRQQQEEEARRKQEEEMLERVLELSLTEK